MRHATQPALQTGLDKSSCLRSPDTSLSIPLGAYRAIGFSPFGRSLTILPTTYLQRSTGDPRCERVSRSTGTCAYARFVGAAHQSSRVFRHAIAGRPMPIHGIVAEHDCKHVAAGTRESTAACFCRRRCRHFEIRRERVPQGRVSGIAPGCGFAEYGNAGPARLRRASEALTTRLSSPLGRNRMARIRMPP